jgi:hypothetical protein
LIAAAPPNAGREISRAIPRCDARTLQQTVVGASPETTYRGVLDADIAASPAARALMALGQASRLRDVLAGDTPWTVLADLPGDELVLGLLWSPPAGCTKRPRSEWPAFADPGFAKVAWGFSMSPLGGGRTVLMTETRTAANDAATLRRFRVIWAVIRPLATLLRRLALNAIRAEAEASAGRDARDVER